MWTFESNCADDSAMPRGCGRRGRGCAALAQPWNPMIKQSSLNGPFAKSHDRHSHPGPGTKGQLRRDRRTAGPELVHAAKNARSVPRLQLRAHPNRRRYANRHAFADCWTAYISLPLDGRRACQGWPPCGRQEPEGAGGERCRRRVARTADSPERYPHRHFVTSCSRSHRHQSLLRSTPALRSASRRSISSVRRLRSACAAATMATAFNAGGGAAPRGMAARSSTVVSA